MPPPVQQPELVLQQRPLALQQPIVVLKPNIVPENYVQSPPMPPVDWGMIAHALFTIAEREHAARHDVPN